MGILFSEPIGGEITIAYESEMFSGTSMETYLAQQLKNCKFSTCEENTKRQGCYYTTIPRVVKQKGIYGEDITSLNMDKVFKIVTHESGILNIANLRKYYTNFRHISWKQY